MFKSILLLTTLLFNTAYADFLNCPCKVVKVVDGDTVHVLDQSTKRHKIRLGGIDTPERKQAFGRRASKNLAMYVAGKYIEVEYSKRDRYKRIIGKLLLNNQDINLQQVKDGYAWHYKYYQKDQTAQDRRLYSEAENRARAEKLGLWSASAIPPWEFRRKRK